MEHTSLVNFMNNTENIINNIITNEDFLTVETNKGNVVVMSEHEYECLIETMCRNRNK